MTFSSQQVCDAISELIIEQPNSISEFSRVSPIENYDANSLIFITTTQQSAVIQKALPAVVVTCEEVACALVDELNSTCVISVNNVRLAQALVKAHFDDLDVRDDEWPNIHPSAVIHTSATIGNDVRVGPNVVIGKQCIIGDNTVIRSNSVIERNVTIGTNCVIHSLVNINQACTIGNRVILRPGVIIGNEGFGFAKDDNGHYHRIPHTGTVEIQDDVQVGSNSNIDRGTYGKTLIQRGVKMDAFCHVAHNVNVGEDTLLVAQCGVAGSSNIGKNVVLSGQSAISDHCNIAEGVVLVHRGGVTEDITEPGMWAGTPAKPMKEYVRNLNSGEKIKRLERKLNAKIKLLDEKIASISSTEP